MSCSNIGKLCNNFIISQDVTFADNTLTINLPDGVYENKGKYCLVIAQPIPETTTISAPVVITIGDDTTTTYSLVKCDCSPVYACSLSNRTRYSTRVATEIGGGRHTVRLAMRSRRVGKDRKGRTRKRRRIRSANFKRISTGIGAVVVNIDVIVARRKPL